MLGVCAGAYYMSSQVEFEVSLRQHSTAQQHAAVPLLWPAP